MPIASIKMKNRIYIVITSIIVAILLMSLFVSISTAQTPKEQFDDAKRKFEEARENFNSARLKYNETKDRPSRDELEIKTTEYFEKTIDYLIALLEVNKLELKIAGDRGIFPFNASDNMNTHIILLEDLKMKISDTSSPRELIKSVNDLNDIAIKIKLETAYYAGILNNYRYDIILGQADKVSANMESEIQNFKEHNKFKFISDGSHFPIFYGIGVGKGGSHLSFPYIFASQLDEQASSFKNLLKEAKENHQKTLELFSTHEGFDSNGLVTNDAKARVFLDTASDPHKDTVEKLNTAAKQLREVFKEIKNLSEVEKP